MKFPPDYDPDDDDRPKPKPKPRSRKDMSKLDGVRRKPVKPTTRRPPPAKRLTR